MRTIRMGAQALLNEPFNDEIPLFAEAMNKYIKQACEALRVEMDRDVEDKLTRNYAALEV